MTPLIITSCDTISDLKKFVQFPYDLYKTDTYWIPPMKEDELKTLQTATNPAFSNCDAKFWIIEKNGKVAGRIGAIINKRYNERVGEQMCRLSRLEFIDDKEVSNALLDTVENWAKEKRMIGVHGPLGFTNFDHQALLVEGFDHLPSIASEYHFPYYRGHLEAAGYNKEIDWVEFRLKLGKEIPGKALKLNDDLRRHYDLKVVHFTNRKEMKAYAPKILALLNVAFSDLFSFVKMDKDLSAFYIDKYYNILNPGFVKVVEDRNDNLIGFIVSIPSLSEAMQKSKGKLFPLGWYYILQSLKSPKVVDLLISAIHPDWQAKGISALLITELQKVMIAHGVEYVETTGNLETNNKVINHWKNYSHIQHKRKRCFKKLF